MAVEPFLGTKAQKAFIATTTIQAIIVLVMVAITFGIADKHVAFRSDIRYKTLPCYLALFALAECFQVFMAFDALRMRNVIQLFGILLFHLALLVSAAVQVNQTKTALVWFTGQRCVDDFSFVNCDGPGTLYHQMRPFLIVVPCVIGASWLVLVYLFKRLYEEFGWAIFHIVGANPKMKTMYQYYQIMICLLKFDFFFFTGVTMQLLILVLKSQSAEFGLTIAAIPIVLILLILCGLAVQREIKPIMAISLVMMLASLTYFIYKLVRFYQPQGQLLYSTTRASLTIFTIIAFILLFATFGVGVRCFSDFDRGLQSSKMATTSPSRPTLTPKHSKKGEAGEEAFYQSGTQLAPRISIE